MNKYVLLTVLVCASLVTACNRGASTPANTSAAKTPTSENKTTTTPPTATASTGSPAAAAKEIYEHAIKRNCAAIPPMLTEDFKKAVGTSKDELDALCDTFTDSGKVTSVEVKDGAITGDTAKVTVTMTFKDGKKEDKEEDMKKENGKWVMDS